MKQYKKIANKIMEIIEAANPEIKGIYTIEFVPISAEPEKPKTLSDKIFDNPNDNEILLSKDVK